VKHANTALPQLGDVELAALEFLWQVTEADVGATHKAIGKRRGISPNTVGSALERLHKKRLVNRHKISHAFVYSPALGRDEYAARRVVEAAGGQKAIVEAGLLSAFVDLVADVDEAALDRLEDFIAQKRERKAKP
jgi:predicted transcriptional regulator